MITFFTESLIVTYRLNIQEEIKYWLRLIWIFSTIYYKIRLFRLNVNMLGYLNKIFRFLLATRPGMPDQNFENQRFLIEHQDFIRIFFFKNRKKIRSFFSEVQEIFISLLKDKMAMFFLCIKENWTLRKQHNLLL